MADTVERAPFPKDPEEFSADERVFFNKVSQNYTLEDEKGEDWDWLPTHSKWVPATDEAIVRRQQSAYITAGVDEDAPAFDPRKRKAASEKEDAGEMGKAKKQKAEEPRPEKKNSAVYVSSLPDDVTEDELRIVFSRYGVIAESTDNDKPRIKLYYDDEGDFKGDALIVYFRHESVQLAIEMLDETDFRLGQQVATGPMRVREADPSAKKQKDKPLQSDQAKTKGTNANRDRQKIIAKTQQMNKRLADWDDNDPQVLPDTSSRWDKVVVLKHMFTLQELAEDPTAILDVKEDVREEAEKYGKVTNVVLYDKEEDGVVTVRFGNATAAEACIRAFDGRWFDKRRVEARTATGNEKFKKSKKEEGDDVEKERLEGFSKFIEGEDA